MIQTQVVFPLVTLVTACGEHRVFGVFPEPVDALEDKTEYRSGTYLWRPSRISIALHQGDHPAIEGQYTRLDQKLPPGESGWLVSLLDLPESWEILNLGFEGLSIVFQNQYSELFRIQPPILNELNLAILKEGAPGDPVLEALWRKYASRQEEGRPLRRGDAIWPAIAG